jgi:hypothetical protein
MANTLLQVQPAEDAERLLDEPADRDYRELRVRVDRAVTTVRERGRRSRPAGWLRQLGLLAEPSAVRIATGFRCSVTGTTLRSDCQLETCRYHVDYEWSANCLLAYMHQQNVESLSVDEISFLYRIRADTVKQAIDTASTTLRSKSLDIQSRQDEYLVRRFRHFCGPRLCCVCEEFIGDETVSRNLQVERLDAIYCSKQCRDAKPPRIIELEAEHGLSIERILTWTFWRYRNLALAEQSLQMPRWLVAEACNQYLGRPLDSFFPALQRQQKQRRSALIRRTWHTPRWVMALTKRFAPVVEASRVRFGPATVDTAPLRQRLYRVLETV